MRLVATEYLSLDGVFEEPGKWSFPFFSEDVGRFKYDELQASDALLLGRTTYDGFAGAWPTMQGAGDFGVKMNSMPKYVVTSSSEGLSWSGTVALKGDVAAEVGKLKGQPGGDLLLAGSAQLFEALSNAGLIDIYRLMVHPIALGAGQRLFRETAQRRTLGLLSARTYDSGVVVLEYERAQEQTAS